MLLTHTHILVWDLHSSPRMCDWASKGVRYLRKQHIWFRNAKQIVLLMALYIAENAYLFALMVYALLLFFNHYEHYLGSTVWGYDKWSTGNNYLLPLT